MQDNEHHTPQHSDDSSAAPAAPLVRVESSSRLSQPTPLVLDHTPSLPWGQRLLRQGKAHAQLLLGICVGAVTTVVLGQTNAPSPAPIGFKPLALTQHPMMQAYPSALTKAQESLVPVATPSPPPLTPGAAPVAPQLQFIDRFYFADQAASGAPYPTPARWLTVDRFYFSPPAPGAVPDQPMPMPPLTHPPVSMAVSSMERRDADQYPTGILEVPPPPELVFDSPPSYGDFAGEISQAVPPDSTPHTLLGVVKTRQFGAALIQTHGSAYSVRVGDSLRQSSLKLTALDQDRAILSNGQRTFVVNVGEQF